MPDRQTAPTSISPPPCHLQTPSTVSNIPTSEIQAGAVTASESQSESDQTANNVLSDSLCSICLSRLTIAGEQVGQFFDCKEEADILQVRTDIPRPIGSSVAYVSIAIVAELLFWGLSR